MGSESGFAIGVGRIGEVWSRLVRAVVIIVTDSVGVGVVDGLDGGVAQAARERAFAVFGRPKSNSPVQCGQCLTLHHIM